jgi:hypothetical protein
VSAHRLPGGPRRLKRKLRDDVLAEGDLVAVVSTGPSSVAADLRDARDREGLNRAIQRVVNGPSVLHGIESGRSADPARLQHHAQVALSTTAEVMRRLGQVRGRQKYLVMLSSRATAAASLEAMLGRQAAPVAGDAAPADLLRQLEEIAAAARQAEITVRVIDPQDPASTDLLRALK